MRRTALLGLILLSALAAAAPPVGAAPTPRIIGGRPTPTSGLPFVGFVNIREGASLFAGCTGSLVAPSFVLTAAHCVTAEADYGPVLKGDVVLPENVKVALGQGDVDVRVDWLDVDAVYRHPAWDAGTLEDDYALLHLTVPSTTLPIDVVPAGAAALYAGGTDGIVAGWGLTGQAPDVSPSLMQYLGVTIDGDPACTSAWGGTFNGALGICVGTPGGPTPCFGDSGGPLVVGDVADGNWPYVVGDLSYVTATCGVEPSVYAELLPVRDWIATTAGLAPPTVGAASLPQAPGETTADVEVTGIDTNGMYGRVGVVYGSGPKFSPEVDVLGVPGSYTVHVTRLTPWVTYGYAATVRTANGSATTVDGTIETDDTHAPRVKASRAAGLPGTTVRLAFALRDNSNYAGTVVSVRAGARKLRSFSEKPWALNPARPAFYYRYRLPKKVPTNLRWCIQGIDGAGNLSAVSCAAIKRAKAKAPSIRGARARVATPGWVARAVPRRHAR